MKHGQSITIDGRDYIAVQYHGRTEDGEAWLARDVADGTGRVITRPNGGPWRVWTAPVRSGRPAPSPPSTPADASPAGGLAGGGAGGPTGRAARPAR